MLHWFQPPHRVPLCKAPRNTPACTRLSSSGLARRPSSLRTWCTLACTQFSYSCPAKGAPFAEHPRTSWPVPHLRVNCPFRILTDSPGTLIYIYISFTILPRCPLYIETQPSPPSPECIHLSSAVLSRHPLGGELRDLLCTTPRLQLPPALGTPCSEHPRAPQLIPTSASAVLPGCHQHRESWDTLACVHFSFSCPAGPKDTQTESEGMETQLPCKWT